MPNHKEQLLNLFLPDVGMLANDMVKFIRP
jgi:hypothetical protein